MRRRATRRSSRNSSTCARVDALFVLDTDTDHDAPTDPSGPTLRTVGRWLADELMPRAAR
jgi:hypothetical protein